MESPIAPHTSTPAELKERLEAERAGEPYLVYRDADRHQHIYPLGSRSDRLTIGRLPKSDLVLEIETGAVKRGNSQQSTDGAAASGPKERTTPKPR